ncbi:hypothetical protein [Agaribacterium sp. ZY112]|uniref:hypothetical protein n=1 Tax=Agaribacterium sp. ZY112 TaxID=3233574 RepID=UPI0035262A0D
MKNLLVFFLACSVSIASMGVHASGAGLKIEQIYYCSSDFALKMSNGEWYLVQKSRVGEQKLSHFLSMAMFMMASGKRTANVYPGEPISWCGSNNMKPITILSVQN